MIHSETRWLVSEGLTGLIDELARLPDHAFSTLIETGAAISVQTRDSGGTLLPVGEDRLTGEVVTIDEVDLELTEYRIKIYGADGELLIQSRAQLLAARAASMAGWSNGRWTGEVNENDSPVTFGMPGDRDFSDTTLPRLRDADGAGRDIGDATQIIQADHAQ